jgi:hypothetical protein
VSAQDVQAYRDPDLYSPAPPSLYPVWSRQSSAFTKPSYPVKGYVFVDFDVDGQTATAILVPPYAGLAQCALSYPCRAAESLGHLPVLQKEIDLDSTVLTCDTGIAANEAIQAALLLQEIRPSLPITAPPGVLPALPLLHSCLLKIKLIRLLLPGVSYTNSEAFDSFGHPRP